MKKYTEPSIEVIRINDVDVIQASGLIVEDTTDQEGLGDITFG